MPRSRILFVLTTLFLAANLVTAQDQTDLAAGIDQQAAAGGLPAGDGIISPAEQGLSAALHQEITAFSASIAAFEQSSPENATWMDSLEQGVSDYNQYTLSSASTSEPLAQTLTAVSNNLNSLMADLETQAAGDAAAQSILASVSDTDANEPLSAAASDAYAEQIMNTVMEHHRQQNAEQAAQAQEIMDAFNEYNRQRNAEAAAQAKAIQDAFNEYVRENAQKQGRDTLSTSDQSTMVQSVIDAIDDYLNQSDVKRKETVKRRIKRMIDIMVPSHNLPINGYWRPLPYTTSISGTCINLNGNNDGPGTSGVPNENPGEPLCGYAPQGQTPYITWTDGSHPYLPGTSSMYGQSPQETFETVQNGQGQTTGSVKVTTFTEYEVISPTQIRVHMFRQEAGGCTQNAHFMLELVTPDDSVCPIAEAVATPEPTPTEPPPVQGTFKVGLPLINDETQCDETNTPPQPDEVIVVEQNDHAVTLDYGTGTQVLYPSGKDYYEYSSGRSSNVRHTISLSVSKDRTNGFLSWSISNLDTGKLCSYGNELMIPASESTPEPTAQPVEAETPDDPSAFAFKLNTGTYSGSRDAIPGLDCPDAVQSQIPALEQVVIRADGDGFTLASDGMDFPMAYVEGQYMYSTINADNSMVYLGIFGQPSDGHLSGMYSLALPEGQTCAYLLEFVPAP